MIEHEYINHYDESKKITLKLTLTRWFKFFRLILIIAIAYFLYNLFGSDVRRCNVVSSNEISTIANCDSDMVYFDNEKYKGGVTLNVGDSINIYSGKTSGKVRKVKLNYSLMEE